VDGSVDFVTENLDAKVWWDLGSRNGNKYAKMSGMGS